MKFSIELLPESYSICRLDPSAAIPTWAQGGLVSITRTPDELSIVCQQKDFQTESKPSENGVASGSPGSSTSRWSV